jgi:lipoprotein-anchoring transpeptidase ErfK/SrfK
MSACGGPGMKVLRHALVASVALAFVAGLATPADAYYYYRAQYRSYYQPPSTIRSFKKPRAVRTDKPQKAAKASNPEKDGFVDIPKTGVLQIAISIGSQRLSLYRDGVRVGQSPVSTGTPGHPTPMGVFSVIEKDRFHRSNLYGDAPMFFMQRVTWSGVAMHEGMLPGYAASHGCIRLPRDFAARLWPTTKLGVRVIIARGELAPVDFQHPTLFAPAPKPAEPKVAMIEPSDGAKPGRPIRMAESTTTASDAVAELPDRAPEAPAVKPAAPAIDEPKPGDTAVVPVELRASDAVVAPVERNAADDVKPVSPQTAEVAPGEDGVKATGTVDPIRPEAAPPVALPELRKAVEAPQPLEPPKPARAMPATPAAPAITPAGAAPASDPAKPEPSLTDPPKPMAPPRTKSADQPVKRNGQVAVFVSRKEKKIFVRQGFVPLFDMPITIEHPDQPLGTHVFTAMGLTDDGAGMRWNLITVPTDGRAAEHKSTRSRSGDSKRKSKEPPPVVDAKAPSSATEALNRIQMPKEAVERISEILIPGSSLVVSDQGLGRETRRLTEFIVETR